MREHAVSETIRGLSESLRLGRISCREIVERCLARIDDQEAVIRAWVSVDREGALRRADELDRERQSGQFRGRLHGIPVGIKDIIDVKGWPTVAGAVRPVVACAEKDAPVVAQIRDAGAVILGKTVTTQFACFDPSETRNPWNPDHTPGGSSSGSAAAVATGMCFAALGSQTGGSIIRPASYCGVCGFKPTFGLVSTQGVVPVAASLDHVGPIARCVSDLSILFEVICGSEPFETRGGSGAVDEDLVADQPPILARIDPFFSEHCDPKMLQTFNLAIDQFQMAGAHVEPVRFDFGFEEILKHHRTIMAAEAAEVHSQRFSRNPDDYLPCVRGLVEEGFKVAATNYIGCRKHQLSRQKALASGWDNTDALVCPATPSSAPDLSSTGDPAFNSPWSYLGFPVISIPIGLGANGLPVAIQLVGRPRCDLRLLRIAAWCEAALPNVFGA